MKLKIVKMQVVFPFSKKPKIPLAKICKLKIWLDSNPENGDNHIQNINLGRYIVGYMVENHVLWLRSRITAKLNFQPYIQQYTSPIENFEYSCPLMIRLADVMQCFWCGTNQGPLDLKSFTLPYH